MKGFLKYHIYDRLVIIKRAIQLNIWKHNTPILVHTMAKVGSLSVYNSIKRKMPITPVFHTHSLDIENAKKDIAYCFDNNIYPGSRSPVFLIHDKIISKQRDYKIISLYRDPIERNISAFFDAFELYVGTKPEAYNGDLKYLETLFHKYLPYNYPLEWFDNNFYNDTLIDVYKYPFNSQLGYTIIKQDGIECLIMNCYLEDSLKEKLIVDFCGIPSFKLINTNITANRTSGKLYKAFKEFIRFDKNYLEEYYNSRFAKHFFTETQIKNAIEKWKKQSGAE